jgi:hypothetical protein
MNELIEKISSYNLFNYLLPGILFVIITKAFFGYSFNQENIVISVFVYYFIGLVISRFGSLIIEPLLKKISFLKFADYKNYISASKADPKIEIFSEANNMYRTFCSMFILLLFFKLYNFIVLTFVSLQKWNSYIMIGLLLILFLWSYKKQTEYIRKRIESRVK